uniref:Unkown protein n=1 Tax=Riptortus pedestris TaxID=329032 RepID=R4WDV7_RIPPE|nr:unkown protein [Riptortus pedestris]
MSSSEQELKGGHPPAVKAGGMRITQHKSPRSHDVKLDDPELNNAALKVSTSPEKALTISGAPVRGNSDFPAEAVQSFHNKPMPSHEPNSSPRPHIIQQPRK